MNINALTHDKNSLIYRKYPFYPLNQTHSYNMIEKIAVFQYVPKSLNTVFCLTRLHLDPWLQKSRNLLLLVKPFSIVQYMYKKSDMNLYFYPHHKKPETFLFVDFWSFTPTFRFD